MFEIVTTTDLRLEAMEPLRTESLQEGYKFMERLCGDWVSGANRFDNSGEALFLAVADSQVVGVCGLNRDPYAHDPRIGRIRRLYVLTAYRRHGVGRALVDAVVAHARGHFDLLRVRTEAADKFYTAHGFQREVSGAEATHILALKNVTDTNLTTTAN
jgi:GNAT superfamily N-acetyltransferase